MVTKRVNLYLKEDDPRDLAVIMMFKQHGKGRTLGKFLLEQLRILAYSEYKFAAADASEEMMKKDAKRPKKKSTTTTKTSQKQPVQKIAPQEVITKDVLETPKISSTEEDMEENEVLVAQADDNEQDDREPKMVGNQPNPMFNLGGL